MTAPRKGPPKEHFVINGIPVILPPTPSRIVSCLANRPMLNHDLLKITSGGPVSANWLNGQIWLTNKYLVPCKARIICEHRGYKYIYHLVNRRGRPATVKVKEGMRSYILQGDWTRTQKEVISTIMAQKELGVGSKYNRWVLKRGDLRGRAVYIIDREVSTDNPVVRFMFTEFRKTLVEMVYGMG